MSGPTIPARASPPYVDELLIGGRGGVHHIWACDHYETTLNAMVFKRICKEPTDKVKNALSRVAYGDRKMIVDAIVAVIHDGGLFAVDVDIVLTKIGQVAKRRRKKTITPRRKMRRF
jgi:arsenite oxidase large subunit